MLHWRDCGSYSPQNCSRPSWMVWKKRLPGDKVAVLISNLAEEPQDVRVMWWQVGSACRAGVALALLIAPQNKQHSQILPIFF